MKIFGPCHERTANGDRCFKAPTEQVSKKNGARMCDASDVRIVITRPSITGWKVTEKERMQKSELLLWLCVGSCATVLYLMYYPVLSHTSRALIIFGFIQWICTLRSSFRCCGWWLKSDLEFLFDLKS